MELRVSRGSLRRSARRFFINFQRFNDISQVGYKSSWGDGAQTRERVTTRKKNNEKKMGEGVVPYKGGGNGRKLLAVFIDAVNMGRPTRKDWAQNIIHMQRPSQGIVPPRRCTAGKTESCDLAEPSCFHFQILEIQKLESSLVSRFAQVRRGNDD